MKIWQALIYRNRKEEPDMLTFILEMNDSTQKVLTDLSKKMGKSKAEVLRTSIAALKILQEAKDDNKRFGIASNDNKIEKEIVIA